MADQIGDHQYSNRLANLLTTGLMQKVDLPCVRQVVKTLGVTCQDDQLWSPERLPWPLPSFSSFRRKFEDIQHPSVFGWIRVRKGVIGNGYLRFVPGQHAANGKTNQQRELFPRA